MLSVGDKAPGFTLPNQDGENVSLDDFEYIDGSGPWKELIGAKCTGAFLNMKEGYFLWNAKCSVTDETMKRINEFANKKD